MARQVELANNLGPQQRDDVGRDRKLEAGEDFLGDRGAAEHVTSLQYDDLAPGFCEIGGIDQSVVSAADHDDVVVAHEECRIRLPYNSQLLCRSEPPCTSGPSHSARASTTASGRATTPSAPTKGITSMNTTRFATRQRSSMSRRFTNIW